jgi:uncharacterized protein (TIGR03437 family)
MRWTWLLILVAISAPAPAQFFLYVADAVDAASYTAGLTPGAVFVVRGSFPLPSGLGMSGLPLEQSLNGASVVLTPAGGGEAIRAWMIYTYADYDTGLFQIAALLPSATAPGDYRVSVLAQGSTAQGAIARVVERKYRSLTNNQEGYALAVIQNYVSSERVDRNMFVAGSLPDGQTKSPANPGQTVVLWGLGLGGIQIPDNTAPGAIDLRGQLDVRVAVGGIEAAVLYAGRSPQFPGIDQINFTIPDNAPTGCNVALQVTVEGAPSNPVTMAVASPGDDACAHPLLSRAQLDALDNGQSFITGEFNLAVYSEEVQHQGNTRFAEAHTAVGYFGLMTAGRASALDYRSVAPGRCSLVGGDPSVTNLYLDAVPDDSADAGRVTVSGPGLPGIALDGENTHYYRLFSARLEDGSAVLGGTAGHLVAPGNYILRSPGGVHVGPFETSLQVPELQRWTNRDATQEVGRDAGIELSWTGGGTDDQVIIQGGTFRAAGGTPGDPELDAAAFLCRAVPGSKSFTVPASVLRSIPPTEGFGTQSTGVLRLAVFSGESSSRFIAPFTGGRQIETGIFGYLMMTTKFLPYR